MSCLRTNYSFLAEFVVVLDENTIANEEWNELCGVRTDHSFLSRFVVVLDEETTRNE